MSKKITAASSGLKYALDLIKKMNNARSKDALKKYQEEFDRAAKSGEIDIKRLNKKFGKELESFEKEKIGKKVKRRQRKRKYGDNITSVIEIVEENPKKIAAAGVGLPTAFANKAESDAYKKNSNKKPVKKRKGGMVTKWESRWG
mgnify:FL=1